MKSWSVFYDEKAMCCESRRLNVTETLSLSGKGLFMKFKSVAPRHFNLVVHL